MNRAEFEALGDKHKKYEGMNQQYFMPMLPIMVRLDGKAFHTFTKGLARPYDARMSHCMAVAAKAVLEITQGLIAYTQSDEITVIIPAQENMFYGGRRDKINSVLAAAASVAFNKAIAIHIPEKAHLDPVFDCRSWQYPTNDLCVESLLWRETDATRNSLTMACSAVYKQHELQHKGFVDQHNMLHEKASTGTIIQISSSADRILPSENSPSRLMKPPGTKFRSRTDLQAMSSCVVKL